jgi:hypothetical protein
MLPFQKCIPHHCLGGKRPKMVITDLIQKNAFWEHPMGF